MMASSRVLVHAPWNYVIRMSEIAIFTHVTLIVCAIWPQTRRPIQRTQITGLDYTSGISIFATFMSDFNSSRIPDLARYLAQSDIPPEIDFQYWFINYTNTNISAIHSVYPPDEYRAAMRYSPRFRRYRRDLDLSSKFFFCLRFFREISSASWFYRATDDTIINFPRLLPFMQSLERKYNPRTDVAVLGNCIDIVRFSYLQGGSGILFSRCAALQLVGMRDEFLRTLNRPEDVFLVKYLQQIGVTLFTSTCEYFIGHDILTAHRWLVWNGGLSSLPGCPDPAGIWRRECRPFVSPLNDIVFWHQEGYNRSLGPTIQFSKMVLSQPRNVMWWLNRGRPTLCQGVPLPRGY
jgi:hypothetical protein